MTLVEIAERIIKVPDAASKPPSLYELYDTHLAGLGELPLTVLELGVHKGDSLKVFSTYFKLGKVIGVDIKDPGVDFSAFANAVFCLGDQRNAEQLHRICAEHAPAGLDIIIDDASHYGSWSLLSYEALFPLLKPGGLYVVEDWATGYWDDWPDGSRYQRMTSHVPKDHIPKRVPSHDSGMVGFIKYLIDEIPSTPVTTRASPVGRGTKFVSMHIYESFVVLKKQP